MDERDQLVDAWTTLHGDLSAKQHAHLATSALLHELRQATPGTPGVLTSPSALDAHQRIVDMEQEARVLRQRLNEAQRQLCDSKRLLADSQIHRHRGDVRLNAGKGRRGHNGLRTPMDAARANITDILEDCVSHGDGGSPELVSAVVDIVHGLTAHVQSLQREVSASPTHHCHRAMADTIDGAAAEVTVLKQHVVNMQHVHAVSMTALRREYESTVSKLRQSCRLVPERNSQLLSNINT